jgi:hypothetical protein
MFLYYTQVIFSLRLAELAATKSKPLVAAAARSRRLRKEGVRR